MTNITIVGAGVMGSALCWPLRDNGHTVRLVGTHLDDEIIDSVRATGLHPKHNRVLPDGVQPYYHHELPQAVSEAEIVVSGVSSFGVHWFADTCGPWLQPGTAVVSVTKGLEDTPEGDLMIFPDVLAQRLPAHLQGRVSQNAIGGPCIARELAARRHTSVVFCGRDKDVLARLKSLFATPYYHIHTSTDLLGVEVCVALKNAYALSVGIAAGMMEKAGPDGQAQMLNPQAALFAQCCYEMRQFLQLTGGGEEHAALLPGAGDLFVTVFGGRTPRLGRLIGLGMSYSQARAQLAGETLECVEIITCAARALAKLEQRGTIDSRRFPPHPAPRSNYQPGQSSRFSLERIFLSGIESRQASGRE